MVATALKTRIQIVNIPPLFIFTPTLDNFRGVFFTGFRLETNFKSSSR